MCKEILKNTPKKLIVLDNSEFALFNISRKLKKSFPKIDIQECLLDLKDSTGLRKFFELNDIDIVYHAAAYKHVHLVEKNIRLQSKII